MRKGFAPRAADQALADMLVAHKIDSERIQCSTVGHREVNCECSGGCSRHVAVEHGHTVDHHIGFGLCVIQLWLPEKALR
jgi:hypothetical protein